MTVNFSELMAQALEACNSVSVDEAKALAQQSDVKFVDVRDLNELQDGGKIKGAIHASRGMLEFLIAPESPYYNKEFDNAQNTRYVVYCMSGGRSALATARMKEMGYPHVYTLDGGFKAWCSADGECE